MNNAGHRLIDELNKLIDERLDDPTFSIESICQTGAWVLYRYFRPPAEGAVPGSASNILAILPFTNLGVAESEPACEGVMDEVYSAVSLMKPLKVIARSSMDKS